MALRKGKSGITVILKDNIIKILGEIAEKELTSRSAIAAKIIESNLDKYIKDNNY